MPKPSAISDYVTPATIAEETFTRAELRAMRTLVNDRLRSYYTDDNTPS